MNRATRRQDQGGWVKNHKAVIYICGLVLLLQGTAFSDEIHDAVTDNNPARVASLLDSDPSLLELRDEQEMTPLNLAALNGNTEVARMLIERGADILAGDADNSQPIHCAAIAGNVQIIDMLLRKGADINAPDNNGATALTFAAARTQTETVRYLLEKGADVHVRNGRGMTPIFFAQTPMVATLMLERGADPNARASDSTTALHIAAARGRVELVRFLLQKGIDANASTTGGNTSLFWLRGDSALAVARLLIEHGADANHRNDEGITPLHTAAAVGSIEIAGLLLSKGADVNAADATGWTPLSMAALTGPEITAFLLSRGADPNPSEYTEEQGCACVECETPLHLAARSDSIATVRALVEAGAQINVLDEGGTTPLHVGVGNGNAAMVAYLISKGANPNIRESRRDLTALHIAAMKGQKDIMVQLIKAGARTDEKDDGGKTALDHARYHGFVAAAELLETHGAKAAKYKTISSDVLHDNVKEKEATVWYLNHSAWAIKTKDHLLVFDYARVPHRPVPQDASLSSGYALPSQFKGMNATFFITHEHGDHFDPAVFDGQSGSPSITYVLGFRPRNIEHEYVYAAPRTTLTVDGMTVMTIRSDDGGVGFLVEVDGVTILHLGDHANGSPDMSPEYVQEIDAVAGMNKRIDLCFGPILGCSLGTPESVQLGCRYAIEKLGPRVFLPMHAGHATYLYRDFVNALSAEHYATQLAYALNEGDRFSYSGGRLGRIE